ncbi:MAG: flavodoxin [Muribaculaceae bacterium]|nr:flavodoxin [Muribaculaceae bacterium]
MKKGFVKSLLMCLCLLPGLNSCAAETSKNDKNKNSNTEMTTDGKKLVVFFSHTGENYSVGYIEKGNTHIIADMIADATGADRFEIVPEKGYPEDSYDECIAIAKKELQQHARPAVKGDIAIEDYDVIFVGYPQWWGEPPMCVYTFIEKHDWTGKTVIPFVTHEGSGMGSTDRKIASACKGADVAVGKGLAVEGKIAQENRDSARKSVNRWLERTGFKK